MAQRESNVDFIDDKYSSGDSNMTKPIQCKEENNNEINELSKNFNDMGCIVDAMKRPNICVENCVYESDQSGKEEPNKEDDAYSDEFEEDNSASETEVSVEASVDSRAKSVKSEILERAPSSGVKMSKSQSSMSSNKRCTVSGRSDYGSISVPRTRRINMSFTNERLREIERHNHILLSKILSATNNKKSPIPSKEQQIRKPVPPAAVLRKNQQRKIDHENMILLKKIQGAKSSACSIRR